jgi:hypothetical protein
MGVIECRFQYSSFDASVGVRDFMRFVLLLKRAVLTEENIATYNDELVRGGVLLAGERFRPGEKGARVLFHGEQKHVSYEVDRSLSGLWLIQAKSQEEAIEWVKRSPFREGKMEVRQVLE